VAKPRSTQRPTPGHRLAHAAYALHTAVEAQLHGALDEMELTMPLSDVLWQLDPASGPVSRGALAERLHCDPSNVTYLVARLEERRLVSRERPGSDRRVTAVALTRAGVDARDRLIAAIAESKMFSALTRTEQRQLADLLRRCTG
jgi:MarR family transcriptional regulator, organic hydroperoxide resistance regulator